ncbi:MAG: ribonuclease P protein component [Polyangiales bacterium]
MFDFPKARRVHRRAEYLEIQARGAKVHSSHFLFVLALDAVRDRPARLGITVTRRVGNAVHRNRCKRVCKEAFRLQPGLLPNGVCLLVIAKTGAPTLGLQAVQREWASAWNVVLRRVRELESRAAQAASIAP